MAQGTENRWPWADAISCSICKGKAYLVCQRDDGREAVERCDACADGVLSDEQAAVLARRDGIDCEEAYPCYVKGKR
jgi:hypothetical protein